MITLLIPTLNRSDLLIKQLGYYSDIGFQGTICIGDSSNAEHVQRTKKALKVFQSKLDIVYREYPFLHDAACVQRMIELVKTSYAVFTGDDDFYVPSGLERCVAFLEENSEYSAAHGIGALAGIKQDGSNRRVVATGYYRQQVSEEETACQRLIQHLTNYAGTVFSVHRTNSLRAMYQRVHEIADRGFAGEALPSCLTVVMGKVRELDCFYLVRQVHDERYLLPTQFDWITTESWLPSYQVFADDVSGELARRDGISMDAAQQVLRSAFWGFLAKNMIRQWEAWENPRIDGKNWSWRRVARRLPGVPATWHQARAFLPGRRNHMTLEALLRPGSPYHADFMPIYRAIAGTE